MKCILIYQFPNVIKKGRGIVDQNITMEMKLPIKLAKKEKYYIASCPVFDVYSQGETSESAKKNLGEALTAFFVSCIDLGVLNSVLKESGFESAAAAVPSNTLSSIRKSEYINIPLYLLSNQKDADSCHA